VKNMNQIMKQAKKLQEDMMKAQEALAERTVEGTAGGSSVKVTMNGHRQVQSIAIDKDVVNPDDVEMLQDLLVLATQDALNKIEELTSSEMGKYTSGLNIPGLF